VGGGGLTAMLAAWKKGRHAAQKTGTCDHKENNKHYHS